MKYESKKRARSITLEVGDLKAIVQKVDIFSKEEKPIYGNYSVKTIDGSGVSTDNAEEFNKVIDSFFTNMESIDIAYISNHTELAISFHKDMPAAYLIKTEAKSKLLEMEDFLLNFYKKKNYNYIIHAIWGGFVLMIIVQIIAILLINVLSGALLTQHVTIGKMNIKLSDLILNIVPFVFTLPVVMLAPKFYPMTIIVDEKDANGRDFGADLKWLVGFTIASIIIPKVVK